eukprot:6701898-Heterocapsa_arctica.AAC.1
MLREDGSEFRDRPSIQSCRLVRSDCERDDLELSSGEGRHGLDFPYRDRTKPVLVVLPGFVPNLLPSFSENLGDF